MITQMVRGLAIALSLTVGLELVHGLKSPWSDPVERLIGLQTGVFAIGVFLVWAFIVFFHALTNRFWVAVTIVSSAAGIIGLADYLKIDFRGEPLFLMDATYLSEMGFLVENIGAGTAIAALSILLSIPLFGWMFARFVRRRRVQREDGQGEKRQSAFANTRRAAYLRVVAATAALTVIFTAGTFNWPGSPARALYEVAGANWRPWNQIKNYEDNGVIAGLLYTLPASPMDEPEGYSEAAMNDLVERFSQMAHETNVERDENALSDTNIVVILSETLSDPLAVPGITVAEDPLPYHRELMAQNPSGTMISSGYGGGTSNIEFEVITGMALANLQAQVDSAFQSVVADAVDFPSHLQTYRSPEREAIAIHPYDSKYYRRLETYPALNFDRWAFEEDLPHLGRIEEDPHVADSELYGEILRELRGSEDPMLINAVSMQNHGPQEGLSDPIEVDGSMLTYRQKERASQYARGLKHSDDALRELVADINELDERTIVLLYGDHLPSVWPAEMFEGEHALVQYQTPWVVFANFPLAEMEPETYGPNQLMNQLVDAAGAPHTPWNSLLDQFAEELPVMQRTAWLDPEGTEVHPESLTYRARQLLQDYRLAQYDMVVGEGWATDALLSPVGDQWETVEQTSTTDLRAQ